MFSLELRRFARAETGAITVDFIVLTSAIVGLGIGVALIVVPMLSLQFRRLIP